MTIVQGEEVLNQLDIIKDLLATTKEEVEALRAEVREFAEQIEDMVERIEAERRIDAYAADE